MSARPHFPGRAAAAMARPGRAFTLVEILTSMTVLLLLLTMFLQMINGAMSVTAGGGKRLNADSQARLTLDRMAVDFAQIVKRQDVDYYFQKNGSGQPGLNDQMAFYSETSGYFPAGINGPVPKSNAALVGYRVNNHQLQRLNKALVWNGVSSGTPGGTDGLRAMTFLPQTLASAWPSIIDGGTDADYEVIGEQIFRMEICYLVRNASTPAKLSDTPYLPVTTPATTTTTVKPYNGLRDVVAVVVSLAVLDDASRLIVQPAALDTLTGKLDDVDADSFKALPTKTPAQYWQGHIDNNDLVGAPGSGLPQAAASQVRIYERYFYLGNSQ